jgi:hypothetical protein
LGLLFSAICVATTLVFVVGVVTEAGGGLNNRFSIDGGASVDIVEGVASAGGASGGAFAAGGGFEGTADVGDDSIFAGAVAGGAFVGTLADVCADIDGTLFCVSWLMSPPSRLTT